MVLLLAPNIASHLIHPEVGGYLNFNDTVNAFAAIP